MKEIFLFIKEYGEAPASPFYYLFYELKYLKAYSAMDKIKKYAIRFLVFIMNIGGWY